MLVIGATGGTGRAVVEQARQRGIPVAVLVRDAAAAADMPEGTRVHVGDVLDPAAVAAAVAGEDTVVCALGVRRGQPVGTVRSDGTRVLVAAMEQAGARRLVAVSSVGVGSSVEHMSTAARLLWPRIVGSERLAEAERAERAIMASGLDWTVVRPPRLVDAAVPGELAVGPGVAIGMRSQLPRARLAGVLVDLACGPQAIREALTAAVSG